jgi:hypothetical protein
MNLVCFQSYLANLAGKMLYEAAIFIYSCTQRVYERLEVILADTHLFNAANLLRKLCVCILVRMGPKYCLTAHLASLLHYSWPSQI